MRFVGASHARSAVLVAAVLAIALGAEADHEADTSGLPFAVPERPFLLVDAPRRFTPQEDAKVRIQLREGGPARLALFRVTDTNAVLALAGARNGTTVASAPLGREAESLLVGTSALPRAGSRLALLRDDRIRMPVPRGERHVGFEEEVYDSNEEEEENVATYWVRTGRWSVRNVDLGRLDAGLYLVRVLAGPWATTAILSVGDLVVLARRGDREDVVFVSDAMGEPERGVTVRAIAFEREVSRGVTDARGEVRLRAHDAPDVRFVVERGTDLAWADVSHARLSPCDPRVYVATGRPLYRIGETVYVRGQVRGCNAEGRYVGLANEEVKLSTSESADDVTATTDADGNFVAELVASSLAIVATHRGRRHERPLRIDSRQLPRRDLRVRLDRASATPGDVLTVTVADDEGGWPREAEVVLETPAGRQLGRIGPRTPAVFHLRIPATDATLERFAVSASVSSGRRVTIASAELFVGRHETLLALDGRTLRPDGARMMPITVRATSLAGAGVRGPVELAVYESDPGGNAPRGRARHTARVETDPRGRASASLPLTGDGPFIIEAKRGDARARMVVWDRPRPPQLSGRGPLAIQPHRDRVSPGETVAFDVRLPSRRGAAWVTLEQGNVLASVRVSATSATRSVSLAVPDEARGAAKLVVAHVDGGEVRVASATVEVATSREIGLSAEMDKTIYGEGETAKLVLTARTAAGAPSDGVASVWLADAGYWGLGEDEYPLPGDYLSLPGRMASAGDSTRPIGYGAEEGRVLPEAHMKWKGQNVRGTTYRHAWGYYGEVVRARSNGDVRAAAQALARAAGLRGAWVCPAKNERGVSFEAIDLPWDLVAEKIAELTESTAELHGGTLRFACEASLGLGGMGSIGHGAGGGGLGVGMGSLGTTREERLEGTLFFAGLVRLGEDGRAEIDIPLPRHPGRWRVESLVIADDGGGARAHAVVHTRRGLELALDAPRELSPGDEASLGLHLSAPGLAGREVALEVALPEGVRATSAVPVSATLDAGGVAEVSIPIRAERAAEGPLVVRARQGTAADAVRTTIRVREPSAKRPVALRAFVAESALDVLVPLGEPTEPSELRVVVDAELAGAITDALEALHEPRWHIATMRIDRLASLDALARAAREIGDHDLERRADNMHAAEAAALHRTIPPGGGLAWWGGLPESTFVTAEALLALGHRASDQRWADAWSHLRTTARGPRLDARTSAAAAELLAGLRAEEDRELARRLLGAAIDAPDADLDTLARASRAARLLGEDDHDRAVTRLEAALRGRLATPGPATAARGPVWFLCYGRWGDRGEVARAADALLDVEHPEAAALARRAVRWLATTGVAEQHFVWGSSEGDELALATRVFPRVGARTAFSVLVDGRSVRVERDGSFTAPRGARTATIRFDALDDRIARLRVDGTLTIASPTRALGNAELVRRFVQHGDLHELDLTVRVPSRQRDVLVVVPLPAGLEIAATPEPPAGATMSIEDGALHLRFAELSPTRTRIRIPLAAIGPGTYEAAPAHLATRAPDVFALVPATRVEVR